jgi:hypothetical protein
MKLFDLADPFFEPLWIRVAVVAVTTLWGLFELTSGALFWAMFFLGLAAVCTWRFMTIDYAALRDANQKGENTE